jgi:hypothetical protein
VVQTILSCPAAFIGEEITGEETIKI